MSMNVGAQIVSKLGSANSKIPLAAKDIFNSAGYTYFSYDAGGSIEAKDRFIDEAGTGAIWLFGIPAYKKLIDKTIFKKAGISPQVDIRVVKDKNLLQQAIENAPTEEIGNEIKKAANNVSKTLNLNIAKFALALGLTMLSYFGLTKIKQNMTKKNIEKEFLNNNIKNNKQEISPYNNISPIFKDIDNKEAKSNPSFGSTAIVGALEDLMLNPVKNMIVLDSCISAERLSNARTKGEFAEYAIKEGSFLFFVYCADKLIKKGLETASQKFFKAPIKLDANFLSTKLAENVLQDNKIQNEIKTFGEKFNQNADKSKIYEFIFNNPTNPIVEAAKSSGIISTIKDASGTVKIDTRKYIDTKKIMELSDDLQNFINNAKNSKDLTTYLRKIKSLKVITTLLSVGSCCIALGYIVPKMMYKYRQSKQQGSNDFHVRTEYEQELKAKYIK